MVEIELLWSQIITSPRISCVTSGSLFHFVVLLLVVFLLLRPSKHLNTPLDSIISKMSQDESPETMLNRLSGVLGVDTVFYVEGKTVYLGVHTSAKRIENQMDALLTFTSQFTDYTVVIMGDFNVLLSQTGPTSLQVHSKSLSEDALDASNVQMVVDFRRPLTFVKPTVDTTCKRRWETTQGEKIGVIFSVKIDYIFKVHATEPAASIPSSVHVYEHDVELKASRPPAPWFPADHFTLEVHMGSEIYRSWNICGESFTSDAPATPRPSRPSSAAGRTVNTSNSAPDATKLSIAANCFEFLTAGANDFYNAHPEIMEHFHRVLNEMPEYEGIRFRDRYLGTENIENLSEDEQKRLKSGEISTVLRSCPSVNIHYKAFLLQPAPATAECSESMTPIAPSQGPGEQDGVVLAASVVADNGEVPSSAEAVVAVEGSATPLISGDDGAQVPSEEVKASSFIEIPSAAATAVATSTEPTVISERGLQQMRLLQAMWTAADAQYRASATPLQLALYDQYLTFRERLESIPIVQEFLRQFYAEIVAFDRQDFLYCLLPALQTRAVKVWALQEVSAPLQQKIDRLSRLFQEYGYEVVRREVPASQKTWGLLLVRQDLQL